MPAGIIVATGVRPICRTPIRAVARDEAGAVVHVPAEGAEEGVEEVLADVGLVIGRPLVLHEVTVELLDESGELVGEVLEGAQGGHGEGGCRSGQRRGKSGERGACPTESRRASPSQALRWATSILAGSLTLE